jgi:hypothetical protein
VFSTLMVNGGISFCAWMKLEICVMPDTVADEMIPVVQVFAV